MYSDHSKESFRRIATQLQIQTKRLASLAQSIVLIGCCNANTSTRRRRDLTCDSPFNFQGPPLLAIQHTHFTKAHTDTHDYRQLYTGTRENISIFAKVYHASEFVVDP